MPIEKRRRAKASVSAEVMLAGGLLEANGGLNSDLSVDEAYARLRLLLTPAVLWRPNTFAPFQDSSFARDGLRQLPRWRLPKMAVLTKMHDHISAAWKAAAPAPSEHGAQDILRIEVENPASAQQLMGLGPICNYLVVASIRDTKHSGFAWRWPLRVGVAKGPRGLKLFEELQNSKLKNLYDARLIGPDASSPFDVAFVDAEEEFNGTATCLVVLGESNSAEENLRLGLSKSPESVFVVGAPSTDISWFDGALREMSRDQPIDVALRIALPDSLLAADVDLLPYTAVRQWAIGMAEQLRRSADRDQVAGAIRLLRAGSLEKFDSVDEGSVSIAREVQALEEEGYETTLRMPETKAHDLGLGPAPWLGSGEIIGCILGPQHEIEGSDPGRLLDMGGGIFGQMEPGVSEECSEHPIQDESKQDSRDRHIIADVYFNGDRRQDALLPESDHELLVKIAIPRSGETALEETFREDDLPAKTTVTLGVYVSCAEMNLRLHRDILLSTAKQTLPSTVARFPFHTGIEDSVVTIRILVTHQERPLQEAHYTAVVRRKPLPDDHVQLTAVPLSCCPDPRQDATPADISLEVNGANLENTRSGAAVDLSQLGQTLDDIDLLASRVLGNDRAPSSLADTGSIGLLVSLAQYGAKLKTYLDPLRVGQATTISLLVETSTRVLPLELAYDGPAPDDDAGLCEHQNEVHSDGEVKACAHLDRSKVCPYAFWGLQRIIARTIRVRDLTSAPLFAKTKPPQLSLRPVLYAAVARADANSSTERPTDILEKELAKSFGELDVHRVHDWSSWQQQVRSIRPQLMVILGHTESTSVLGTDIEIGQGSWLKASAVRAELLRDKDAPQPLVILVACASAVARDPFGGLPAAFASCGAAAVVATLSRLRGPHGAKTAARVVHALCSRADGSIRLGEAMRAARCQLIREDLLTGLLIVAHGEIDVTLCT